MRFLVDYNDEGQPEEYWVIDTQRGGAEVPETRTTKIEDAQSLARDCNYLGDDTYGA